MGAQDDYRCDLCSTRGKEADMTLCAPDLFKEAVRAGLRPHQTAVVSAGLVSRQAFEADWVRKALADNTGWGLCQTCVSRVKDYLERAEVTGWHVTPPRGAWPRRWRAGSPR